MAKDRLPAEAVAAIPPRRRLVETDYLALVIGVLVALLALAPHHLVNPDGVSYLDLATSLRRGDWGAFVQSYWSPLYPALIAGVATVVRVHSPSGLIGAAHLTNALLAIACVAVTWRLARRTNDRTFSRLALAILLLVTPRADPFRLITPNLIVMMVLILIAHELLYFGARRAWYFGLLGGVAFLASTSLWPWLLASILVRLVAAPTAVARREVAISAASMAGVAALWIVPMSLEAGSPTLGSTGSLNYCWYLEQCDGRTPDTHTGAHQADRTLPGPQGDSVTLEVFDSTPRWTYEPWSDPGRWQQGIVRQGTAGFSWNAVGYWAQQTTTVLIWLLPLIFLVIVPLVWNARNRIMQQGFRAVHRGSALCMLLGAIGIGQFIAVHVEPRLIAPFALLTTIGILAWLREPTEAL